MEAFKFYKEHFSSDPVRVYPRGKTQNLKEQYERMLEERKRIPLDVKRQSKVFRLTSGRRSQDYEKYIEFMKSVEKAEKGVRERRYESYYGRKDPRKDRVLGNSETTVPSEWKERLVSRLSSTSPVEEKEGILLTVNKKRNRKVGSSEEVPTLGYQRIRQKRYLCERNEGDIKHAVPDKVVFKNPFCCYETIRFVHYPESSARDVVPSPVIRIRKPFTRRQTIHFVHRKVCVIKDRIDCTELTVWHIPLAKGSVRCVCGAGCAPENEPWEFPLEERRYNVEQARDEVLPKPKRRKCSGMSKSVGRGGDLR